MEYDALRYCMREYARLIIVGSLFALSCTLIAVSFIGPNAQDAHGLRVAFLDVGQGDGILIESPTGTHMLIDAGRDDSVLRGLTHELGFWNRTIDVALATHEDVDHIGGFRDVFQRYQVSRFIRTENQGQSGLAHLLDDIAPKEAEVIYARRGMDIDLGGGVNFHVLFPDTDPTFLESNTSSIVGRLTYGDTSFLLTGDSPEEIERHLVSLDAAGLKSDVLKAGHHGSRTSTSDVYLDAVQPTYAVISVGKDNKYGHPHQEVIDRLKARGITILSTAELGSIAFESDGKTLTESTF